MMAIAVIPIKIGDITFLSAGNDSNLTRIDQSQIGFVYFVYLVSPGFCEGHANMVKKTCHPLVIDGRSPSAHAVGGGRECCGEEIFGVKCRVNRSFLRRAFCLVLDSWFDSSSDSTKSAISSSLTIAVPNDLCRDCGYGDVVCKDLTYF
jgi:hypothetical protein